MTGETGKRFRKRRVNQEAEKIEVGQGEDSRVEMRTGANLKNQETRGEQGGGGGGGGGEKKSRIERRGRDVE